MNSIKFRYKFSDLFDKMGKEKATTNKKTKLGS